MLISAPRPSIHVLQDVTKGCHNDDDTSEWVLEHLFKQNNPQLRSAYGQLCVAAMTSFLSIATMDDAAKLRCLRGDGGGDGGGGGDGVATDHAVLGQLVGVVLRAVKNELTKHHRLVNNWRRQEEFFHMLKQILALPSVPAVPAVPSSSPEPSLPSLYQHYLYDIGLMEGLLGYFIGGCLKGMATWVSIVNNPQYGNPNFVPVSAGGGWLLVAGSW
jgi:hypothetical protein